MLDGKTPEIDWSDDAVVGVVLASKGYPGDYKKGIALPPMPVGNADVAIYHAGTIRREEDGAYLSNGGRLFWQQLRERRLMLLTLFTRK